MMFGSDLALILENCRCLDVRRS